MKDMAKAKTISDINSKYHYKDENPGGKRDANLCRVLSAMTTTS